MKIEDDELRELFKIECEEHLQHLNDGLLKLEKNPDDPGALAVMFREAHSLKGAAHMLSLSDIENISHHLEDIFSAAAKDKAVITPDMMDRVYTGLDAIRTLACEAITGETAGVLVPDVIKKLNRPISENAPGAAIPVPESEISETCPTKGAPRAEAKQPLECPVIPEGAALSKIDDFSIETIRVKTRQLDELMSQLGELTVSKIRIGSRLGGMEQMIGAWDGITKIAAGQASASRALEPENSPFAPLENGIERLGDQFSRFKSAMHDDIAQLDFITTSIDDLVREIRLLPLSTLFSLFPRMARDLSRSQKKEIELLIEGGDVKADKRILEEMKDPLMHLIRNAVDHGIELPADREKVGKPRAGTIQLNAYMRATDIIIEIKDDGRGLDTEAIKHAILKRKLHTKEELAAMTDLQIQSLIFSPGFSTSSFITNISGRGVGLDVVQANVERLKGTFQVESFSGMGTAFRLQFPVTMATTRVLIVLANGMTYALPVEHVLTATFIYPKEIRFIEGREAIVFDGQAISVVKLADLLEIRGVKWHAANKELGPQSAIASIERYPCAILSIADERIALVVDDLTDEQEIVLKPHGSLLKRVRNISGTTILGTGEVCMVLNPNDLLKTARKQGAAASAAKSAEETESKKLILAVDDSITTRTQIKRILERGGYEVVPAVNGLDAYSKLSSRPFDAIVSDITMPVMDGLTLTKKVREDKKYKELPVILVTALASEEDRKKGLEVGADAYITKPAFDERLLLDTLRRII
ncbi:MAG: hybrid sensor histidine kinase/response regulator [Desulfobacteraceae bacterium]|nr:MAG: hybrid sensor histidine kinase/response regulator [Desulfobacteraceae bacterium]